MSAEARSHSDSAARRGRRASAEADERGDDAGQHGIQSVEICMRLMEAMLNHAFDAQPPMLKTLAAEAGMPPAKAHRYMVSLLRTNMVERAAGSGRYQLGAMARMIGVRAIQGMDIVRLTVPRLADLRNQTGQSVALAIWTASGPTIIAVEDDLRPVTIATRVGQAMPLISSATGQVFGAWFDPAQTAPLVQKELRDLTRSGAPLSGKAEAQALFDETRERGHGLTVGGLNPTVNAVSAPIFDHRGELAGALSCLGQAEELDATKLRQLARLLMDEAAEISRGLGYTPQFP